MLDTEHIKNNHHDKFEIDSILHELKLEYKITKDEFVIKECPFCHFGTHQPDNQWKLNVRRRDGVFFCFRCSEKGTWEAFKRKLLLAPDTSVSATYKAVKQEKNVSDLWSNAQPIGEDEYSPAIRYLRNRGLKGQLSNVGGLRYHNSLPYYENGLVGHFPAILGACLTNEKNLSALQRIYITPEGHKANVACPKKTMGTLKNTSVHLAEPTNGILNVAEGIETSLAILLATGQATWSTISAGGLETFLPPPEVTCVNIWADRDRSLRGEEAANKLANILLAQGLEVTILVPPAELMAESAKSLDWLDVYCKDPFLLKEALANAKPLQPFSGTTVFDVALEEREPDPIDADAFHGIAGEIVRAIEPHTESDPAAILIQFLTGFGNVIGRNSYYLIEATKHHFNLFSVLVGNTSKGRKGTSWEHVRSIFYKVAMDWCQTNIKAGLSTGEGIVHHVRDERTETKVEKDATGEEKSIEKIVDAGVQDKRLLALESEFASVLKVAAREGNTLSTILRQAWDQGNLSTLTKNSPEKATDAHVSIVGHITKHELQRYLSETEALNGFGNRFLWVFVKRSKSLPFGGNISSVNFTEIYQKLSQIIFFASQEERQITFSYEAGELWKHEYERLTADRPGLYGAMTARAEAQAARLASVYAVLDCSSTIEISHLRAALAVWDYCQDTCFYIFGKYLGDHVADRILSELRENPCGLTRTEIRELFHRKQTSTRIEQALRLLYQYELAYYRKEQTGGRPIERWFAATRKGARKGL